MQCRSTSLTYWTWSSTSATSKDTSKTTWARRTKPWKANRTVRISLRTVSWSMPSFLDSKVRSVSSDKSSSSSLRCMFLTSGSLQEIMRLSKMNLRFRSKSSLIASVSFSRESIFHSSLAQERWASLCNQSRLKAWTWVETRSITQPGSVAWKRILALERDWVSERAKELGMRILKTWSSTKSLILF